jgi:hypothetical protein
MSEKKSILYDIEWELPNVNGRWLHSVRLNVGQLYVIKLLLKHCKIPYTVRKVCR